MHKQVDCRVVTMVAVKVGRQWLWQLLCYWRPLAWGNLRGFFPVTLTTTINDNILTAFKSPACIKVAMNKQCTCLFIIISIDVYYKSEYIPTVTSFASILVNCFYFLQKMTAQRLSALNFRGWFVKFCKKSSGQSKMALLVAVTKNGTKNLM